ERIEIPRVQDGVPHGVRSDPKTLLECPGRAAKRLRRRTACVRQPRVFTPCSRVADVKRSASKPMRASPRERPASAESRWRAASAGPPKSRAQRVFDEGGSGASKRAASERVGRSAAFDDA